MSSPTKVLFVALDAADKDILLDGVRAGRFPTFGKLLKRGVWGIVENPVGLYVGAVWPSFATGTSPARHGVYSFRRALPASYAVCRVRPDDVRGVPFWSRLSDAGHRVAIVDVPRSNLPERLNGLHVVDWRTHDPDFQTANTWPPEVLRDIESHAGGRGRLRDCDAFRPAEVPALRDGLLASADVKRRVSEALLERGGWSLFLTTFTESHCAGHQFWHLHDGSHPRHRVDSARSDPLLEVYASLDAELGRLIERAGPGALVIVLASHGIGPHYGGNPLLEDLLKRIESKAPAPWTRSPRAEALDLWRNAPLPLRAALAPLRYRIVRWMDEKNTRLDGRGACFAVPNNDGFGGIRVNIRGREPRGTIAPGRELEAFTACLERDLLDVVNSTTGRPAIANILRVADVYRGPAVELLPDLLVEWNQEAPVESVYSAKLGTVARRYDGNRTGDHRPQGLFVAVGPSIRPKKRERPVSITDFAPTICSVLGIEPKDMDGVPIPELALNVESERGRPGRI